MEFDMTKGVGAVNANTAYAKQFNNAASVGPRELGAIERMQGLVSGIATLNNQLGVLRDRVDGPSPKAGQNPGAPPPAPGLVIALSDAEAGLRQALASVDALLSSL